MPKSVRQLLDDAEADILMRMNPVRKELSALERELADVRTAKNALGPETGRPQMRLLNGDPVRLPPRFYGGGEVREVEAPSPYAKLTMKQLVRKALDEHFTNGATANELLDFFRNAWGRHDVVRTSLSPQLSRLKREKVITLHGLRWRLAGAGDLYENEAPNGGAAGASEADGGATPSNHQPERTHW